MRSSPRLGGLGGASFGASEDDIRPEMLQAMNMYSVRWLTRVCKVACRTG